MILSKKKVFQKMADLQFSNADLIKKAGISSTTLARAKNGRDMRASSAGKIAQALRVSVADLMD